MFDLPSDIPPQYLPVMVAQATQAQAGRAKSERVMGVCKAVPNGSHSEPSLMNVANPVLIAKQYFYLYEQRTIEGPGKVTHMQRPKHGAFRLVTEADRGQLFSSSSGPVTEESKLYAYLPEPGYIGKDSATILVEVGGHRVKVIYFFQAVNVNDFGLDSVERYCGKKGLYWKISYDSSGPYGATFPVLYCPVYVDYQDRHNNRFHATSALTRRRA